MELTAPQKTLLEADEQQRTKQRAGRQGDINQQARYYIDLLRSGKIKLFDLTEAAVLGDEAARIAATSIGEEPPTIGETYDIITLFGQTKNDLLAIFTALYTTLKSDMKLGQTRTEGGPAIETAGWALGQIKHRDNWSSSDWQTIKEAAFTGLRYIVDAISLTKVLEIIRPYLIKPILKQPK